MGGEGPEGGPLEKKKKRPMWVESIPTEGVIMGVQK